MAVWLVPEAFVRSADPPVLALRYSRILSGSFLPLLKTATRPTTSSTAAPSTATTLNRAHRPPAENETLVRARSARSETGEIGGASGSTGGARPFLRFRGEGDRYAGCAETLVDLAARFGRKVEPAG